MAQSGEHQMEATGSYTIAPPPIGSSTGVTIGLLVSVASLAVAAGGSYYRLADVDGRAQVLTEEVSRLRERCQGYELRIQRIEDGTPGIVKRLERIEDKLDRLANPSMQSAPARGPR